VTDIVTGQIVRVRSRQYLVEEVVSKPSPEQDTSALLNLVTAKTLILLDRGFYHFQFLQQLINQEVHFITRLKAKASIKYLKIFSYDHSLKDRLIQLGTGRGGAPVLTLRLIEIKVGKNSYSYITSVLEPQILPQKCCGRFIPPKMES
jgi:hypothetical protein